MSSPMCNALFRAAGSDNDTLGGEDEMKAMMSLAAESLVNRIHMLDVSDVVEAALRESRDRKLPRGELFWVFTVVFGRISVW